MKQKLWTLFVVFLFGVDLYYFHLLNGIYSLIAIHWLVILALGLTGAIALIIKDYALPEARANNANWALFVVFIFFIPLMYGVIIFGDNQPVQ